MNLLTTIVTSCDKYSFLWENFNIMFNKYYNINAPTFLITETKNQSLNGIDIINTGQLTWTEMLNNALDQIESEYIFLLLEDYFLTEEINATEINLHLNFLSQHNANKVMIDKHSMFYTYDEVFDYQNRTCLKFWQKSNYLLSTQPSIWRKSFLQSVLNEPLNPWSFELDKTKKIQNNENKIFLMLREQSIYFNAFNKGKPHENYNQFCEKHKLKKI